MEARESERRMAAQLGDCWSRRARDLSKTTASRDVTRRSSAALAEHHNRITRRTYVQDRDITMLYPA